MKHIALDCERMKYENTGLYHYCLNLGRHLQLLVMEGKEQLSFFVPRKAERYFGKNAHYLHQHSLRKYYMPSLRKFDIWHATFQDTRYMPLRNQKVKVVLSVHDLNFMYEKSKEEKRTKYLSRVQRNMDRAEVIICISEYAKQDVLKHCRVHPGKIRVIHNGANELQKAALEQKSYRPKRPFLFSIGVINRKKNFHALLPLIAQLQDTELIIAGRLDDPHYHQYLLLHIEQLGIEDRVHIVPNITEAEKAWYYNHCTAFLMPSIAEGFGLPVIEAMSVGKPTFLSSATALPEIGGEQAFYFEDFEADHMKQVFHEGMEQYKSKGMESSIIAHSRNFSWERAAHQYWEVYRSLL